MAVEDWRKSLTDHLIREARWYLRELLTGGEISPNEARAYLRLLGEKLGQLPSFSGDLVRNTVST